MCRLFIACVVLFAACASREPQPGELLAARAFKYMAVDDSGLYGSAGDATVVRIDLVSRTVETVVDLSAFYPGAAVVGVRLVADSMYLGYTSSLGDGIVVLPKTGGLVSPVAVNESLPFGLLADQDRLYWQTNGRAPTREIRTVIRSGGTPETLATGAQYGWTVALGDDALYWSDAFAVMRAPKSDLAHPVELLPHGSGALAVDSTNLYFLGLDGPSAIPKTGGVPRTIAGRIPFATFVADDLGLYVMGLDGRVLPDGPTVVSADGDVTRLATYYGWLFRLDGRGRSTIIADAIAHPWSVALDSKYLYWALDTAVYRVRR